MTVVNVETGEILAAMSADDARRLTERIRIAATNYTDAKAKVLELVDLAKAGSAHIALGYKSWSAYLSDVLSDEPLRLAREDRRELVNRLADEGMSNVAIGKVLGVDDKTIGNDIRATSEYSEVAIVRVTEGLDGRERITVTSGCLTRPKSPAPEFGTAEYRAAKWGQAFDALKEHVGLVATNASGERREQVLRYLRGVVTQLEQGE